MPAAKSEKLGEGEEISNLILDNTLKIFTIRASCLIDFVAIAPTS